MLRLLLLCCCDGQENVRTCGTTAVIGRMRMTHRADAFVSLGSSTPASHFRFVPNCRSSFFPRIPSTNLHVLRKNLACGLSHATDLFGQSKRMFHQTSPPLRSDFKKLVTKGRRERWKREGNIPTPPDTHIGQPLRLFEDRTSRISLLNLRYQEPQDVRLEEM